MTIVGKSSVETTPGVVSPSSGRICDTYIYWRPLYAILTYIHGYSGFLSVPKKHIFFPFLVTELLRGNLEIDMSIGLSVLILRRFLLASDFRPDLSSQYRPPTGRLTVHPYRTQHFSYCNQLLRSIINSGAHRVVNSVQISIAGFVGDLPIPARDFFFNTLSTIGLSWIYVNIPISEEDAHSLTRVYISTRFIALTKVELTPASLEYSDHPIKSMLCCSFENGGIYDYLEEIYTTLVLGFFLPGVEMLSFSCDWLPSILTPTLPSKLFLTQVDIDMVNYTLVRQRYGPEQVQFSHEATLIMTHALIR